MLFSCLFQCFKEKEYQTEFKRNETFGSVIFWNERDPESLECKSRSCRGSHEIGGPARPCRVCPLSRGPLGRPPTYFFLLYIPTYPENIQEAEKHNFPHRNLLYPRDPILDPSPALPGGGIDHGGLLHQHHSPSDEL